MSAKPSFKQAMKMRSEHSKAETEKIYQATKLNLDDIDVMITAIKECLPPFSLEERNRIFMLTTKRAAERHGNKLGFTFPPADPDPDEVILIDQILDGVLAVKALREKSN